MSYGRRLLVIRRPGNNPSSRQPSSTGQVSAPIISFRWAPVFVVNQSCASLVPCSAFCPSHYMNPPFPEVTNFAEFLNGVSA